MVIDRDVPVIRPSTVRLIVYDKNSPVASSIQIRVHQICIVQGPQADTVNGHLIHYALVNCEVFASMPLLQQVCLRSDNVSKVLQIQITK